MGENPRVIEKGNHRIIEMGNHRVIELGYRQEDQEQEWYNSSGYNQECWDYDREFWDNTAGDWEYEPHPQEQHRGRILYNQDSKYQRNTRVEGYNQEFWDYSSCYCEPRPQEQYLGWGIHRQDSQFQHNTPVHQPYYQMCDMLERQRIAEVRRHEEYKTLFQESESMATRIKGRRSVLRQVKVDEERRRMGVKIQAKKKFLVRKARRAFSKRGAPSIHNREKKNFDLKPIPYQPRIPFPERLSKADQLKYLGGYMEEENLIQKSEPTIQDKEEDQFFEDSPKHTQHEEVRGIETKTYAKREFFIDEFDEILEKEWKERQAQDDMTSQLESFDADEDLRILEELLANESDNKAKEEEVDFLVLASAKHEPEDQNSIDYLKAEGIFSSSIEGSTKICEAHIEELNEEGPKKVKKALDTSSCYHKIFMEEESVRVESWVTNEIGHHGAKLMETTRMEEQSIEDNPKKIPPKPPEAPFSSKPPLDRDKHVPTRKKGPLDNLHWKNVKKELWIGKKRPREKGCYEHKRDKWKDEINNQKGARCKEREGVKASPDATAAT